MSNAVDTSSDSLSPPVSDAGDYFDLKTRLDTRLARYQPVTTTGVTGSCDDDTVDFLQEVFRYLPPGGRSNLVEDVCECASDNAIRQLAESIDRGVLKPMLAAASRRLGLEEDPIEGREALDLESAARSSQPSLREKCLARDGNRCVISGLWNRDVEPWPAGEDVAPLQAAHIIPFSLGEFGDANERREKLMMWTSLFRCFPYLRSLLTADGGVNQEENIVTLVNILHNEFVAFRMTLEATATPNRYRIKTFRDFTNTWSTHLPESRMVTLTSHDGRYPLPSPRLLAVHAAISNILYATARGEKIMNILRELGDGGPAIMARDGSTDIGNLLSMTSLALISPEPTDRP